MEELQQELKQFVIDTLNLEDVTADDIDARAPLFVEGLGLDSIDALELGFGLKKKYGVTLSADNEQMRQYFYSIETLAEFILKERKAQA